MAQANRTTIDRLEDQLKWYGRAAKRNQSAYKGLRYLEIIAAAFIPFLAGEPEWGQVVGGLGVAIVILAGVRSVSQVHENWLSYRRTVEQLNTEQHLWTVQAGPYYDVDDPNRLFAERLESIMGAEGEAWQDRGSEVGKKGPQEGSQGGR